MSRLLDKISCKLGNHRYTWQTTTVTQVTGDVYRVEFKCANCGRHDCFLTTYLPLAKCVECLRNAEVGTRG